MVKAKEEKAPTGSQRFFGLLDLGDIFLQIQRFLDLFADKPIVVPQAFEDSMGVGSNFDIESTHFIKLLILCRLYLALYLYSLVPKTH